MFLRNQQTLYWAFSTAGTSLIEILNGCGQDSHMSPVSSRVDRWRTQIYSAEDQFSAILNRGGVVDFFGSTINVPSQRRFGDIDSVETYIDMVFEIMTSHYPLAGKPRVRVRKGMTRAHYEFNSETIAIPISDQWALRETVILHEYAHHLTAHQYGDAVPAHGREFAATMLVLINHVMGDSAALLLRTGYHEAGVPILVQGDFQ